MSTRTGIYLRISSDPTDKQAGVSRQRKDCLALCAAKGWEPTEYVDNDISAASGKRRPAYEQMLADIRDGNIGAVVAWDLDRLHRRPIELEHFMALADEHKIKLATASGDVDLSTPQGQLIARMKGAVAAHEIAHMRARMRAAARQKAEQGRPQWRRAFGYRQGDNGPEPDPATAPLVAKAYRVLLAGASLGDICRVFNDAGAHGLNGQPWTATTASLFLRAPRNAGLRSHNGEVIGKGTWPPLVSEDIWRAAQVVLNAAGRTPAQKSVRRHLLTGVLRCGRDGCDGRLSGYQTINKRVAYRCKTCLGVSVRAEHVEPLVRAVIAGRLARPDAEDLLQAQHDEAEAEALRTERTALLTRLDEIADERADGQLTGPQAKRATERVQEKLAVVEHRERDAEKTRVLADLPLGRAEVAAAVEKLSPDRLRAVIGLLCEFHVLSVGKGSHVFDPERVQVVWN